MSERVMINIKSNKSNYNYVKYWAHKRLSIDCGAGRLGALRGVGRVRSLFFAESNQSV